MGDDRSIMVRNLYEIKTSFETLGGKWCLLREIIGKRKGFA